MSDESKKSEADGRSASHTAAGAAAEVARGVGQRGPGRRSQKFVAEVSARYGMLPGDLLASTLMGGLPDFVKLGGDPGDWMRHRAKAVAAQLGVKDAEAFGMLLGVAKELMPYVHQKQPIAIDVEQRSIVFAAVTSDGQVAAPGTGRRDLRPADVREKPMISVDAVERSDAGGRTHAPNALNEQEE